MMKHSSTDAFVARAAAGKALRLRLNPWHQQLATMGLLAPLPRGLGDHQEMAEVLHVHVMELYRTFCNGLLKPFASSAPRRVGACARRSTSPTTASNSGEGSLPPWLDVSLRKSVWC